MAPVLFNPPIALRVPESNTGAHHGRSFALFRTAPLQRTSSPFTTLFRVASLPLTITHHL